MSHIDYFNKAFVKLGRWLSPDDGDSLEFNLLKKRLVGAVALINATRKRAALTTPPIHFGFIDNPSVNASAVQNPTTGEGYIGICAGAAWCVDDLFNRVFSHPHFAEHAGDAKGESKKSFHEQGIVPDYSRLLAGRGPGTGLAATIPRDTTRATLSYACAQMAFDYLVLHEVGHLAHGHYGYLREMGIVRLLEFDSLGPKKLPALTRQALELQADSFASIEQVTSMARAYQSIDLKKQLSDWMFSIGMLYLLMPRRAVDFSNLKTADHPPPILRLEAALRVTSQTIQRQFPQSHGTEFLPMSADLTRELDKACDLIGHGKPIARAMENFEPTEADAWFRQIDAELQRLKPKLKKYRSVPQGSGSPVVAQTWEKPARNDPPDVRRPRLRCLHCGSVFDSQVIIPKGTKVTANVTEPCPACHRKNAWTAVYEAE